MVQLLHILLFFCCVMLLGRFWCRNRYFIFHISCTLLAFLCQSDCSLLSREFLTYIGMLSKQELAFGFVSLLSCSCGYLGQGNYVLAKLPGLKRRRATFDVTSPDTTLSGSGSPFRSGYSQYPQLAGELGCLDHPLPSYPKSKYSIWKCLPKHSCSVCLFITHTWTSNISSKSSLLPCTYSIRTTQEDNFLSGEQMYNWEWQQPAVTWRTCNSQYLPEIRKGSHLTFSYYKDLSWRTNYLYYIHQRPVASRKPRQLFNTSFRVVDSKNRSLHQYWLGEAPLRREKKMAAEPLLTASWRGSQSLQNAITDNKRKTAITRKKKSSMSWGRLEDYAGVKWNSHLKKNRSKPVRVQRIARDMNCEERLDELS